MNRLLFIVLSFVAAAAFFGHTVYADPAVTDMKSSSASEQTVTIQNFKFDSANLVVSVGTKVTWVNQDSTVHTVASSDKSFPQSSGLDTGDKYSYVFTKPGTYAYYCTLHPFMTGKIVVKGN